MTDTSTPEKIYLKDHTPPTFFIDSVAWRGELGEFAAVQMLDVHTPTTDGRELVLTRYTEPEREIKLLLERLELKLPAQPPPRITAAQANPATSV